MSTADTTLTESWIRNESDRLAADAGCWFDLSAGCYPVWWIEHYCKLYEGEYAGANFYLMGCHECGNYGLPLSSEFDFEDNSEIAFERAERFAECVKAGHSVDWQYDVTMRLFGWQRKSKRFERAVRRFRQASVWVCKKNKKALALDTPVPTPQGWATIGELKVGDEIFSEAGSACRVSELHPVIIDEETYRVTFSNGEQIVCNGDHLWKTTALQRAVFKGKTGSLFTGNQWTGSLDSRFKKTDVRATRDLLASLKRGDGACNHSLDLAKPLDLPSKDLPIDPYVLGCWLGDGDSDCARMTCADGDFQHYVDEFATVGVGIAHKSRNSIGAVRFRPQVEGGVPARTVLKQNSLFKNKHIPAEYLRASLAQRVALLQGLMDTDGCIDKSGKNITFCSKLLTLADGVCELLASLGVKYRMRVDRPVISGRERAYHWIQFHAFRDDVEVFRLPRKLNRMRTRSQLKMRARSGTLQVTNIERIPAVAVRCITVDDPSGMFLCGKSMIPTHNSPTLASWGMYLTCADGEPGNKVFFGAKDGNQARDIAGEHSVQMVNQSEELQDECKINLNKMRITHLPSKSFLQPMSSANAQTQKGKEGINGSILIDETHVVDRDFIRRVKRAGISRPEPLHIEVSTAGDDPDSYGKERFDYASRVVTGAERNDQLLVAIYAAPQDLTESQLELDPIKYGKMANPAWGHTIDEDEYLADYNSSKSSRRELLDFMMYRLNIWQNSSSPWLKIDDWMKGKRDFTLSDFHGKPCHSALDLSSVRDFSSLCLAFDQGNEEIAMFWWYWLPEETAHAIRHLIDIDKWKSDPRVNLMLTPGARIDYGYIQSTFIALSEKFTIRTLAYDDWNAEQTTQEIEEGKRDREGNLILKGTGVPRINFSQSLKTMNSPTKQFEARVIDGKILHNGDPLTAWMAQNATVKPDANGNYKPMKPSKDSIKKCDGVIVGVMAAAMIDPDESVYKKRGAISIGDEGEENYYEEEDAYSHWS